jgi:hypothetical protein
MKSPFELLYDTKPILHEELKIFGEVGVVTTKDKIQAKLANCGTPCIFVVNAENHSKVVCRMLNLEKNAIINSRDIIWLEDWLKNKLMRIIDKLIKKKMVLSFLPATKVTLSPMLLKTIRRTHTKGLFVQ